MKRALIFIVVLVVLVFSTGCITHIHIPFLWYGPTTAWETFDVAIDVAADGAKHVVHINCAYDGYCTLTHERTYQGGIHTSFHFFEPLDADREPQVPYYRFPDVAVASDGVAYFVWHYRDHDGYYYDCWNYIMADDSPHSNACQVLQDPGQYSPENSYPKVIAKYDVAYAVYEVAGSPNTLYYRQLNPYNDSHGTVTGASGGSSTNPSLAITTYIDGSPVYVLHVAWANNGGNASSKTVYNCNYGTTGNMSHQHISTDSGVRSDPVIAATGVDQTVYVVYRLDGSPDKLVLSYITSPWLVMLGVPDLLNGVGNWELVGRPDMTSDEDEVFIAFTGMNDTTRGTTSFQELFGTAYHSGESIPVSTTRITTNNLKEGDPRIVVVPPPPSLTNNIPVIGWRENSDPGFFRDAYVYYTPSYRRIFTSPAAVLGGYFDMAANGEHVAGIFIDQATDLNTVHNPWLTFNDFAGYLPVMTKP